MDIALQPSVDQPPRGRGLKPVLVIVKKTAVPLRASETDILTQLISMSAESGRFGERLEVSVCEISGSSRVDTVLNSAK